MYIPMNYEGINEYVSAYRPNQVVYGSQAYSYWQRTLYHRLIATIELGIPDFWNREFLQFLTFIVGFCPVFDDKKYGTIYQFGSPFGVGLFYEPTHMSVNTSLVKHDKMKIGEDCEVLRLTPDWMGAADIINFYAEKLAMLSGTLSQSIVNERFAYMAFAKSKAQANALKAGFEKISEGNPLAVLDAYYDEKDDLQGESPFIFQDFEVGKNYISDRILADMRAILSNFDTEIGIPNTPYEKKERLTNVEIQSNNTETDCRLTTWLECLNNSVDKINKMFPDLNLTVKKRDFENNPLINPLDKGGSNLWRV